MRQRGHSRYLQSDLRLPGRRGAPPERNFECDVGHCSEIRQRKFLAEHIHSLSRNTDLAATEGNGFGGAGVACWVGRCRSGIDEPAVAARESLRGFEPKYFILSVG